MQKLNFLFIIAALLAYSCDSQPKIIQSEEEKSNATANVDPNSIPAFNDLPRLKEVSSDEHEVVVEKVLNTERYSYLKVNEHGEKFWLAISKREIEVGDTYYYKGGLLKRNFFSQEFNRVFETVYLVSNIWKKTNKTASDAASDEALTNVHARHPTPDLKVENIKHAESAVKLTDLFSNKVKYANQTIRVTGKVVKVNPMIMNRNWLHLQDGSGEGLDLTVTTLEKIPLGAVVSLEGTIALDKDFGAGYRYDIIMEGAILSSDKKINEPFKIMKK